MARATAALAVALLLAACAEERARDVDAPIRPRPARLDVGAVAAPPRVNRVQRSAAPRPVHGSGTIVGLVASDDDAITAALAEGARRALDEARAAGGPDLALRVSVREPRWGAAAEAAVRLALDEGAVAIIAPPERDRAHAIAQLGTRAGVRIVSTSPAASVMQAGSTYVTSVVAPAEGDPATLPDRDWEQAGYDAAESIVADLRARR